MTTSAASKAEAPITAAGPAADGTTGAPQIRPRRDAIAAGLVVLVVSVGGLPIVGYLIGRTLFG